MVRTENEDNQQLCCQSEDEITPCYSKQEEIDGQDNYWIKGVVNTPAGNIPRIKTRLNKSDIIGSWKARWGINRMNYKVNPGLYCVGEPDKSSPVLVTANYKMSFDRLRKELSGRNLWILVLDTEGINVWCAAGKGTFGTDELVRMISQVDLTHIVSHRTLVLPQLGASGIVVREVQNRSGFKVIFGPVRAEDIKEFIDNNMNATQGMRKVRFSFLDRIVLTPIEFVGTTKLSLMIFGVLFIMNLTGSSFGIIDFYGYVGALVVGTILVPLFLPWIPGKAFAWKGWLLGFFWAVGVNVLNGWPGYTGYSPVLAISYLLILPAISAFYALNFTGASTYTSLSGVKKEMKIAVPLIVISIAAGIILLLIVKF